MPCHINKGSVFKEKSGNNSSKNGHINTIYIQQNEVEGSVISDNSSHVSHVSQNQNTANVVNKDDDQRAPNPNAVPGGVKRPDLMDLLGEDKEA